MRDDNENQDDIERENLTLRYQIRVLIMIATQAIAERDHFRQKATDLTNVIKNGYK